MEVYAMVLILKQLGTSPRRVQIVRNTNTVSAMLQGLAQRVGEPGAWNRVTSED